MKTEHQLNVENFMLLAGQAVPSTPMIPSEDIRRLRAKLIFEETLETIKALGFSIEIDMGPSQGLLVLDEIDGDEVMLCAGLEPDLEQIVDGCCDIKVVTTGTLSACGVQDHAYQNEVDHNNLAKFGPGHSRRADGKLIKPPDHKPPRIIELLEGDGYEN